MGRKSLREDLLNAGFDLVWTRGYTAASVRDVAALARAPQGSFTNHFRSKEEFVGNVLDRYFDYVRGLVLAGLQDSTTPPAERLNRYFEIITEKLAAAGYARGCLAGNLAAEVSPQSERIREHLARIFAEWTHAFANCVRDAQAAGEIRNDLAPEQIAEFLLNSWQGAMLRMKVDRSRKPLDTFRAAVAATLLRKELG